MEYASPFWMVPLEEGENVRASWFGRVEDTFFPLVRHEEHGWMEVDYWKEGGVTTLMYDDKTLGNCLTIEGVYPWIYSEGQGSWLYYLPGTDDPRWFWHANDEEWLEIWDSPWLNLPE